MNMQKLRAALTFAIFLCLQGCVTDSSQIDQSAGFYTVRDSPSYRFRNIGWDCSNITNPLLLTNSRLNHSMIGILRVSNGKKLPRGNAAFASSMSVDQIRELVLENLESRGVTTDLQSNTTTVAGVQSIRITYQDKSHEQTKRGVEYAFIKNKTLFHLTFLADEGPQFSASLNDYERVVNSLVVNE